MKINPYLSFDGRCREAFEFYERALGGRIAFIQTYGESPMAEQTPVGHRNHVMHVTLLIGDQVLQGADEPPGIPPGAQDSASRCTWTRPQKASVCLVHSRKTAPSRFRFMRPSGPKDLAWSQTNSGRPGS